MNEIENHIIQKVRELLDTEENEPETLYDMLYNYRSIVHPDKYLDAAAKKEAEEKFKNLNDLLEKLSSYIEKKSLEKKPSELILFQEKHQLVVARQDSLEKDKIIESLKTELWLAKYDIKNLKQQIKELNSKTSDELKTELQKLYQPKDSLQFGYYTLLIFSSIYLLIGRIKDIREVIELYSPISTQSLDVITFSSFCLTLFLGLKYYFESNIAIELGEEVKDPLFVKKFFLKIANDSKNKNTEFGESDIQEYIIDWITPKNKIFYFMKKFLTKFLKPSFINNLKQQMITNLISKQVIEISRSKNMDRMFKTTGFYTYTDESDLEEVETDKL